MTEDLVTADLVAEDLVTEAEGGGQRCRFCSAPARTVVVDLGSSPLANSYLEPEALDAPEVRYPLCAVLCEACWLVQLPEVATPEAIFSSYAYFSSFSPSWLRHAESYVETVAPRFGLGAESLVVEVASNDGYLLQYFRQRGVPVLGIEPARNVAEHAATNAIPTLSRFLGERVGKAIASGDVEALDLLLDDPLDRGVVSLVGRPADLVVGNNVFAHVPKLNDFTRGLRALLAPRGVLSLEFPHLLRLLAEVQFDTIYHEHFSYYSFATARRVLEAHGLVVFDVEQLDSHGGSLRVFAKRSDAVDDPRLEVTSRVAELLKQERDAGLFELATYQGFGARVRELKLGLLRFLLDARERGQRVVGYGAPAKGNTLLNYCGIDRDLIPYTVDKSPHKQGRYLPGSRIPIHAPEHLLADRPDYVLVLPWNLRREISSEMAAVREWGGRFVVAVPEVTIFD